LGAVDGRLGFYEKELRPIEGERRVDRGCALAAKREMEDLWESWKKKEMGGTAWMGELERRSCLVREMVSGGEGEERDLRLKRRRKWGRRLEWEEEGAGTRLREVTREKIGTVRAGSVGEEKEYVQKTHREGGAAAGRKRLSFLGLGFFCIFFS
jgi:hypothetical protein